MKKIILITNHLESSKYFICRKIQQAWDQSVDSYNRKVKKIFTSENENFIIIDCKEKLESLDNKFIPDVVFIVPELMWVNDDVNEGYNVARELIINRYKSKFIQIAFLSVLDRAILVKIADTRNKIFIEAFPQVCLIDHNVKIKFEYYSEIHYKLIKHLAISDEGRLQKISHEIYSVKANIQRKTKDVEINKNDLLEKLDELMLFQQWTETVIADEFEKIKNINDSDNLTLSAKNVENIIDEISIKLTKHNENSNVIVRHKSNYKVFIVEDDKEYRHFFYNTFSKFFNKVHPNDKNKYLIDKNTKDFNINEADEIIKQIGKNYDIFLLDLLYKDNEGNWLNFNGLDLYQLLRKVNPFAVIRIITSLPRGIVAKVVEVIMSNTEKPNTDQVFTKKYGFDALKDCIIESIEKINYECAEKEYIRTQLFPIPRTGIFDKPGMRDLMISLLTNRLTEFDNRKEIALHLFNLYSTNQLNILTEKWNKGILGKGASFSKPTEKFFLEKIINIMVYRLISIDVALENDYYRIYFDDFLDKISNFSSIEGINNEFFYSLGFQIGNESKNNEFFSLKLSNLLPHESLIIDQKRSERYKNLKVSSYKYLYQWTQNTILNYNYLGSIWKELNIKEFDWFKKNFDKNNITISQLQTFFAHLYANSMKPLIYKVIEHIGRNETQITSEIDAELSKLPELKLQIDLVLNIEK